MVFTAAPNETAVKKETPEERQKRIEPLIADRMKKREEWDAFWKVLDLDSRGRIFGRFYYYVNRAIDKPITFWRENVIEPLQDKHGHLPYYHRRFKRVPTIDDCHVNDLVCYHEAQTQFRLDKLVDNKIIDILKLRREDCMKHYSGNMLKCINQIEDFEEAELNWYIKYGELGWHGDVLTAYMKQKHRMIWERRNPEIMAEREKAYVEHKRLMNLGVYDYWFWNRGATWMYKDHAGSEFRQQNVHPYTFSYKDKDPVSLDPEYHRMRQGEDESKLPNPLYIYP